MAKILELQKKDKYNKERTVGSIEIKNQTETTADLCFFGDINSESLGEWQKYYPEDKAPKYIANLGKYNEGELVGAWFTPPVDFEEVKERIGLNDEYEEYAIHDYELPFEIDEYTPIEEVNRLCEMVEDLPEYIQEELSELQSYFGSIEELCEHEDYIICHSGCDDMADVARYYLEESGQLGELPAHLQNYIDYAAYGRDMELEGTFVVTNHGVYEILR